MKKLLLLFISAIIVCAAATSCRTHERCAAYGKNTQPEVESPFSDKTKRTI